MRLLTYTREIVDGKPIYVSSNSHPVKATKLEPAGHAFHATALRLSGHVAAVEKENGDKEKVVKEKDEAFVDSPSSYSSKGKKKKKKGGGEVIEEDHYALLGLGHLRYLATEDQIRKSYRDTALKHHPDKQASLLLAEVTEDAKLAKKEEIENHFKSIQEAYEILMDPVKRRIYDSTDEFDDEIPVDCAPQDFFKVFGPAFLRNGRWSVNQPIPNLGDDKSPIDEVDGFYDFWYSFKSWREFPHMDEYDLEDAETREHKRFMERQNAKLSEKARKEDYARIRTLVDNAYKRDPRIARRKEELKAQKQRKKDEKIMAKKLQEEEAARVIVEEKNRKEEEEKRAAEAALNQKKLKEKEKKLLRKERARLRTLSAPILSDNLLYLTDSNVEDLCSSLDKEQLQILCDRMEGKEALDRAKLLKEALGMGDEQKDGKVDEKNLKQNDSVAVNGVFATSTQKKEKPWAKEEVELLKKGMLKYPKGTSRRWEVISEFIGTKRSVEEILKATKTVLLQKPDTAKAFDSFLEKRKPSPSIVSPLSTRDEVAVSNGNIAESNGHGLSNVSESSNHKETEVKLDNGMVNGSGSGQDSWSDVQAKALVQALKTFPKDSVQRWERVATAVPGKSVVQCKKKFASMKESFKATTVTEKNVSNTDDSRGLSNGNGKCVISGEKNVTNTDDSRGLSNGNGKCVIPHDIKDANVVSSNSDEDIWSEVQENALVQALKKFPRESKQRWEQVAEAVSGKTMSQCQKKIASLKENFRNKKLTS